MFSISPGLNRRQGTVSPRRGNGLAFIFFFFLLAPFFLIFSGWPFGVILEKRTGRLTPPRYRLLSATIWPYVFYAALIPIYLVLWFPTKALFLFLPDIVAAVAVILLWLMSFFLVNFFYFTQAPAYLEGYFSERPFSYNIALVVSAVPYYAAVIYYIMQLVGEGLMSLFSMF